jgi:hypothetical protein
MQTNFVWATSERLHFYFVLLSSKKEIKTCGTFWDCHTLAVRREDQKKKFFVPRKKKWQSGPWTATWPH